MAKVPEPIKPQKLNGKLSSIAHSAIAQSAIAQSAVRGPVPVPRQRIRRGWLTAAICALSAAAGCTQARDIQVVTNFRRMRAKGWAPNCR